MHSNFSVISKIIRAQLYTHVSPVATFALGWPGHHVLQ